MSTIQPKTVHAAATLPATGLALGRGFHRVHVFIEALLTGTLEPQYRTLFQGVPPSGAVTLGTGPHRLLVQYEVETTAAAKLVYYLEVGEDAAFINSVKLIVSDRNPLRFEMVTDEIDIFCRIVGAPAITSQQLVVSRYRPEERFVLRCSVIANLSGDYYDIVFMRLDQKWIAEGEFSTDAEKLWFGVVAMSGGPVAFAVQQLNVSIFEQSSEHSDLPARADSPLPMRD
jgi:hypothetical protein